MMKRFAMSIISRVVGLLALSAGLGAMLAFPAHAQRHPPEIRGVYPLGGRRGGTTTVTVSGVGIGDATGILFDAPGLTAKPFPLSPAPTVGTNAKTPADPNAPGDVRWQMISRPDAAPGIYRFRIVTRHGLSNVGKWLISRDAPDVDAQTPGNGAAQNVALPVSVNGHLPEAGAKDVFGFALETGKTFVAEVNAASLDSPLDSLLILRDASGQEVASNDDANGPDSLLTCAVKKSGRYTLELASSVGAGGPNHAYRCSFGYLPLLTGLFPASVAVVEKVYGVNLPPDAKTAGRLKTQMRDDGLQGRVWIESGAGVSNALATSKTEFPLRREQEPNDDLRHANAFSVPGAAEGQFWRRPAGGKATGKNESAATQGGPDADFYRFHVGKGQRLIVEVQCRNVGAMGHPVLTLFDSEGTQLDENDDANGSARLDRTFANAGDYFARVREIADISGPEQVYRLVVHEPPPGFALAMETRGRVVERGDHMALEITIARDRWDGPVTLSAVDLPSGVTATGGMVPAGTNRGVIVLTASDAAPLGAFPLHIEGVGMVEGKERRVRLTSANDWVWRDGPRTLSPTPPELIALAVGEAGDVTLQPDVSTLTLTRNGTAKMKVRVVRRSGMDRPVVLRLLGLPDGVAAADVTVPPNLTEGEIEWKARPDAKPGTFTVALLGLVSVNANVQNEHAAPALTLTIP